MKRFKFLTMLVLMLVMALSMVVPAFAAGDSWEKKADLGTARAYLGAAAVNDKIYIFGGQSSVGYVSSVEEYNTVTNVWTAKTNMTSERIQMGVAELNGKIYIAGGLKNNGVTDSFESYDPTTNTWESKAPLSYARAWLGLIAVNGKLYAIGGAGSSGGNRTTVEEYTPLTNTWVKKADLPYPKASFGISVVDNKIYVMGGSAASGPLDGAVYEYNPSTDSWTTKQKIPTDRHTLTASSANGKIYAIGGVTQVGSETVNEEYDASTNTWASKTRMSVKRYGAAAAEAGGKIYVIGGIDYPNYQKAVEVYTPTITNAQTPTNLIATAGNAQITLTWSAVTGATGYNIKRSTTAGGPYTTIASNVYGSPYTDTTVTNGTKYYYVITALNAGGESGNSNEASATPQGTVTPPTGNNRALLVITLVSGLEKEYDLSMTEVNSFTTWYAARAAGTGPEVYTINKSFNKASFLTRKDNIAFDKIELYEVNEYTPAP